VLRPVAALAEVAEIADSACERADGSGYPHRRSGRALSSAARILAVADSACAMAEDRPHRSALDADAIAHALVAEAASGRLDSAAVDAVLASLGARARSVPPSCHGLSGRELDVSRLLARGQSDKEIGATLRISPRTVQVHVARILGKLGVRSRAGAAIWLVENDVAR
jgi:DNA-binding NarL/FixJ family response regulator